MKKNILLLLSVFTLISASCKKDNGITSLPDDNDKKQQVPEFYIQYKANGVLVTATAISALRGTTDNPKTLTFSGSAKDGTNPTFKFVLTEPYMGFTPGLTVGSSVNSDNTSYVEFTDSNGILHTSKTSEEIIYVGFLKLSYTKDGIAEGTLSGKIQAKNGSMVSISEGRFNVKFAN